ncbi:MAG: MBOAT family protein [Planctomycetota bacterium]|nr:MBOAT family protein [Planctomycetota bacterium]
MENLVAAYWPASTSMIALVLAFPYASLIVGYFLTRIPSLGLARILAWSWVLGSFFAVERISAAEPGGFRMLGMCYALLLAMKVVVAVEDVKVSKVKLSYGRWLLWAGLWPGMRPEIFSADREPDSQEGFALILKGIIRSIAGALLIGFSRFLYVETESAAAATPTLLVGVSLVLHFGSFNVLAGLWRIYGFKTYTLFPHPLASKTLSEFWGKRWNLPFTEMCQSAVNKPLAPVLGRNVGAMAAFLYSGIVHEFAISFPVQEGYGLPLLYFLIHGVLILCERKLKGLKEFLRRTRWGHVWCVFWLAGPMMILFHPAFLKGVLWPLIGAS